MTHYGVRLPALTTSGTGQRTGLTTWVELAAAAEASGFASVWVPDPATGSGPPGPESYTVLGALAVGTSRVRLGALCTDVLSYGPGVLAKMATTVDVVSRGRVVLGIRPPDPGGGDRLAAFDEAVRVCRALFTSDDVTVDGDHFHLDHARNLPPPVQAGGPRIIVAAGPDLEALAIVARWADGCAVTGPPETASRAIDALRRQCELIGRDPAEVEVLWVVPTTVLADMPPGGRHPSPTGPVQVAGPVLGHGVDGVDEVVVTSPSIDPHDISGLGLALGLDWP